MFNSMPSNLSSSHRITCDIRNREVRGDHVRHAWESRGEEQKKTGADKNGQRAWAPNVPKSRYATAGGANPAPRGTSSSKSKSAQGWESDEDFFFNKAKVQTLTIVISSSLCSVLFCGTESPRCITNLPTLTTMTMCRCSCSVYPATAVPEV
jgi:hypothetical protein